MISASDGWAVGENWTFLHWNGGMWQPYHDDLWAIIPSLKTVMSVDMLKGPSGSSSWFGGAAVAHEGGFFFFDRTTGTWRTGFPGSWNSDNGHGPNVVSLAPDGNWGTIVCDGGGLYDLQFDTTGNPSWRTLGLIGLNNTYGLHVISDPTGVRAPYYGWYVGLVTDFAFYQTGAPPNDRGCNEGAGTRTSPCWATAVSGLVNAGNTYYRSVYLVNKTDGWAVGDGMAMAHWDGAQWTSLPAGYIPDIASAPSLYAVRMLSSSSGWAVGQNGMILKYTK